MSCNRAYEYFMNHMDNSLTVMEYEWLDIHLAKCDKCKEDFMAYEAILGTLSQEDEIEVPCELEIKIMEQIKSLPTLKEERNKRKKLVLTFVSAVFTGLMALASFASGRLELIGDVLAGSQLMAYTELLSTAADHTLALISDIGAFLGEAMMSVSVFFDGFRYIILFATIVLIFVQMVLRKKDKQLTNGAR